MDYQYQRGVVCVPLGDFRKCAPISPLVPLVGNVRARGARQWGVEKTTGDGNDTKVTPQCWSAADMITTPLFGVCWLPSSGVFSIESSKFFGHIVWNRQCFLTIGPVQQTPYVGFWNSVAIFQPSHPFTMETRYLFFCFLCERALIVFLFSVRARCAGKLGSWAVEIKRKT